MDFRLRLVCLLLTFITTATEENVSVVTVAVMEGAAAVLPLSLGTTNIEKMTFDWKKDGAVRLEVFFFEAGQHYNDGRSGQSEQFKGRVLHFPGELSHGNASIIIQDARVADSGNYTCDFPHLHPQRKAIVRLIVHRTIKDRSAENIPGAAPKPVVRILDATADGVLLRCEVRGASPKPTLEWRDGDGNTLRAEQPRVSNGDDRYDVSLDAAVTKTATNRFRCVATQEEINHKTDDEIDVPEKMFEERNVSRLATGMWSGVVGFVTGVLTLTVIVLIKTRRQIASNPAAALRNIICCQYREVRTQSASNGLSGPTAVISNGSAVTQRLTEVNCSGLQQ